MNDKNRRLRDSAAACLENGRRLLADSVYLEFSEPPTTAYFLSLIAEEEFAKAFLLALVVRGVIPWDKRLRQAAYDHKCKQLLCVVMDYLSPDWDDFLERCNAVVLCHEIPELPPRVVDAITILRFEKIGRWGNGTGAWAEEPEYDKEALSIAKGQQDRVKQDALYVGLAKDGGIATLPAGVTLEYVRAERARAARIARLAEGVLAGDRDPGLDYEMVEEAFRSFFGP